jgi:hypothetical protein
LKKAKWQAPTAKNQKRQIMGNAKDIRRLRSLMPQPVYCDWQYTEQILGGISADGNPVLEIQSYVLTDFSKWGDVLRISPSVSDAVATHIIRFTLDMR